MPAAATPDHTLLRLRPGEFLHLRAAQGRTVAVFQGQLWITQDDELRDTFVGGGETFELNRPGPAMLHALALQQAGLHARACGWMLVLRGGSVLIARSTG
jgi:hypothetical protein